MEQKKSGFPLLIVAALCLFVPAVYGLIQGQMVIGWICLLLAAAVVVFAVRISISARKAARKTEAPAEEAASAKSAESAAVEAIPDEAVPAEEAEAPAEEARQD